MPDRDITLTSSGTACPQQIPQAAAWLGGLGLIPFVAGAVIILTHHSSWANDALGYYAASILAFMGGVRWGLAMADYGTVARSPILWGRLCISVLPALIAWLALLMSAPYQLAIIAAAFAILMLSDLQAVKQGWAPAWYRRLRIPLTAVVLICLSLAAWRMA